MSKYWNIKALAFFFREKYLVFAPVRLRKLVFWALSGRGGRQRSRLSSRRWIKNYSAVLSAGRATLSDPKTFETPSSMKRAKIKLGQIQWRNTNKVLGNRRTGIEASKNAVKYYQKLRKKHLYIANVREDFLQKNTTLLAKTYQHILVEDLNVFRLDG